MGSLNDALAAATPDRTYIQVRQIIALHCRGKGKEMAHLKSDTMATVCPQEDVSAGKEALETVGRQIGCTVLEPVQSGRDTDVDGRKTSPQESDNIQETKVAKGGDERHED